MKILKSALATVTYLLTVCGSFLLNIAPPNSLVSGENTLTPTGIVSFIALSFLLIIKAILVQQKKQFLIIWFGAGVIFFLTFCVFSYQYYLKLDESTFVYFDGTKVTKGDVYQKRALKLKTDYESKYSMDLTDSDLLAKFGGTENLTFVWKKDSIKKNEHKLYLLYLLTVISISISIFCLVEGVLEKSQTKTDD